jgi:hypothetical protein
MRADDTAITPHAVESAMARVLRAEHEARAAMAEAREQATRVAEQARAQARAIAEQRRQRITQLHARIERCLQAERASIDAQVRALPAHDAPDGPAIEQLERAVRIVATQLCAKAEGITP